MTSLDSNTLRPSFFKNSCRRTVFLIAMYKIPKFLLNFSLGEKCIGEVRVPPKRTYDPFEVTWKGLGAARANFLDGVL